MSVGFDTDRLEKWIAQGEAVTSRLEEVFVLSQTLFTQSAQSYTGQANGEIETYTKNMVNHMSILWKFHALRVKHMRNTLNRLRNTEEKIEKSIGDIQFVNPTLQQRINGHADSNTPVFSYQPTPGQQAETPALNIKPPGYEG